MAITATKITATSVLKGTIPSEALPVISKDFNKVVDDLTALTSGTGSASLVDLTVSGTATFNGPLVLGDAAADSLTVNATVTQGAPVNYSNATTITAGTTQTMAGATALTEEVNNVTTVAVANDGVALPTAVAGLRIYVKNSGANNLRIWTGNASDTIDAQSVTALGRYVLLTPGASLDFHAKDAITWESNKDASISISAPTTAKGVLQILSADSAGDTVTTITNASQAAARIFTIPDAGADASFVMSEGAATVNGTKTFGSPVLFPAGTAAAPGLTFTGQVDMGLYKASATELGIATSGTFIGRASLAKGVEANYINGTNFVKVQGAPVNSNTDPAPVSTAGMLGGLLSATPGGAIAYTLPTGTQMATAATWISSGESFDFSLINIGAGGAITVTAAADFTIVGDAVVAAATSAIFRARYTGTNVWILYRIA